MNDKNCFGCLHAKWYVANGGFEFLGCRYPPYKGKWIAEISKCPRKYLRSETMKSVLMAVYPEFCSLIVSGEKTTELRKTRPKIETPFKVYVYCTLPKKSGDAFLVGETPRCANGKVICEFVCDCITNYEAELWDDETFERIQEFYEPDDFAEYGEYEYKTIADNSDDFWKNNMLCESSCVTIEELRKYLGTGITEFYGLHISDLIVYDKPKELSEFRKSGALSYDDWLYSMYNGTSESSYEKYLFPFTLTRPPQSWCYVETEN